jgi:hypothetical protein
LERAFVLLGLVMLVGPPWFWVHCALPMLRHRGAGRMTIALLLGVTAYTVLAEAVFVVIALTGRPSQPLWLIAGLPWLLIVGLPYGDDYRSLLRLARRR